MKTDSSPICAGSCITEKQVRDFVREVQVEQHRERMRPLCHTLWIIPAVRYSNFVIDTRRINGVPSGRAAVLWQHTQHPILPEDYKRKGQWRALVDGAVLYTDLCELIEQETVESPTGRVESVTMADRARADRENTAALRESVRFEDETLNAILNA